jgi:hypothetical protein
MTDLSHVPFGSSAYSLTRHIAIKPIQVEYVMTQIDSTIRSAGCS